MAALADLTFLTTAQLQELQATLATNLLDSGGLYRIQAQSGDVSVTKSDNGMTIGDLIRAVAWELAQRGLSSRDRISRTRVQFS